SCADIVHMVDFKKPPFRPLFGAFYPHPAHKSSLRAEWATHFLAPGKRGWSPPSPGHCSPASRLTPHAPRATPQQRGQVVRRPSHAGYSDTKRRITKDRTGPDLDERPLYIQYVTGRTIRSENPSFFPRSPPPNR